MSTKYEIITKYELACKVCGNPVKQCTCNQLLIERLPEIQFICPNCQHSPCVCALIEDVRRKANEKFKRIPRPMPIPEPRPDPIPREFAQKIIAENTLNEHLLAGWTFKTQLQSGTIIIEKAVDVETVTKNVIEQTNKQVETLLTDVDKQVALAITNEKVKLQRAAVTLQQ